MSDSTRELFRRAIEHPGEKGGFGDALDKEKQSEEVQLPEVVISELDLVVGQRLPQGGLYTDWEVTPLEVTKLEEVYSNIRARHAVNSRDFERAMQLRVGKADKQDIGSIVDKWRVVETVAPAKPLNSRVPPVSLLHFLQWMSVHIQTRRLVAKEMNPHEEICSNQTPDIPEHLMPGLERVFKLSNIREKYLGDTEVDVAGSQARVEYFDDDYSLLVYEPLDPEKTDELPMPIPAVALEEVQKAFRVEKILERLAPLDELHELMEADKAALMQEHRANFLLHVLQDAGDESDDPDQLDSNTVF